MATELTKTQVDRLGGRPRKADVTDAGLRLLDQTSFFKHTTVGDRRAKPGHRYRAVHVIVNSFGKLIEIQVRAVLQQLWAELSEKWSGVIDPAIKYGGGRQAKGLQFITCYD